MHSAHPNRIIAAICVLAVTALACGLSIDLGSTPTPPPPPPQLPTVIPIPLSFPTTAPAPTAENPPAASPEVTVTEESGEVMPEVKDYYQRGYLPFENGQLQVLDDLSKTGMSLDLVDLTNTRQQVQDFALWADIELHTTGSTTYPEYTGCGFGYRVQNHNEGYTAILTNEWVRMGACSSGFKQCTLFGTTYGFGTGRVYVPNGAKAQFSLVVNKDRAWVLVDGNLVGQYSLYTTKLLGTGDLLYAGVSKINAGYMTACEISNVRLWQSRP
jgi:hypothetical protein